MTSRLILMMLLALSSGPAYAEWVELTRSNDGNMIAYIDPDTIRRKGDLVKMWILFDYNTAQTRQEGLILSVRTQGEFDCAEEQSRILAGQNLSGNMGTGELVASNSSATTWEPIVPGTMSKKLWGFACKKK